MEITTSILRKIEKPGRYFAPFIDTSGIEPDQSKPKVLILFPDLFEVAQSHTGVKILYSLFHRRKFPVDFGFAPATDFEKILRKEGSLTSIMYGIDFRSFDLICVSFQYQLQYPAFLRILKLAGIPLTSKERATGSKTPLILAGGPVMCNPEPISKFIDAAFIGEFEPSAQAVMDVFEKNIKKSQQLKALSKIPGIYIPSTTNSDGTEILSDGSIIKTKVTRAIAHDLNEDLDVTFDAPIFAIRTVHDRFTTEITRGCTRGCRFCMAGMFYRPHRERSADNICNILDRVVKSSGYDEAGFLSLSAADHSEIEQILVESYNRYSRGIGISLPSLRTETLTSSIVEAIKKGRKGGFTLAPESGSEKLRKVINKGNTTEDLLAAIKKIFSNGWQNVKLYFMLGLPLETDEDIVETVNLLKDICRLVRNYGKKATVSASFSTFIPQPFTPFQWEKMCSPAEINAKQKIILDGLRNIGNLNLHWHSQQISTVEGCLTRAGREFNSVIQYVAENMTALQTEDHGFDFKLWKEGMEKAGIDFDEILKPKSLDILLPYEHIDLRIDRRFLLREREKAYKMEETPDCINGDCQNCGVCDFETVKPLKNTGAVINKVVPSVSEKTNRGNSYPYIFSISKKGNAASIGHLDLVSFLLRGLAMTGIQILYSDGFHPMPRFNLAFPAPVGVEIEEEYGTLWLTEEIKPLELLTKLNKIFVNTGISFISVRAVDRELIKNVEKILRTAPVHVYTAIFENRSDFDTMKAVLDVVASSELEKTISFDHKAEKGGVLKLFENIEGNYHIIKNRYKDKLFAHDPEKHLNGVI